MKLSAGTAGDFWERTHFASNGESDSAPTGTDHAAAYSAVLDLDNVSLKSGISRKNKHLQS